MLMMMAMTSVVLMIVGLAMYNGAHDYDDDETAHHCRAHDVHDDRAARHGHDYGRKFRPCPQAGLVHVLDEAHVVRGP